MPTLVPIRIPVRNSENVITERVEFARARQILRSSNATPVYERRGGTLVGIQMASIGDDTALVSMYGNPKKYTVLETSDLMPAGVHKLRHLPRSTAALYRLSVTDCLSKAA
jgi:hypothetical protein